MASYYPKDPVIKFYGDSNYSNESNITSTNGINIYYTKRKKF